jgi:hypothetical protein
VTNFLRRIIARFTHHAAPDWAALNRGWPDHLPTSRWVAG